MNWRGKLTAFPFFNLTGSAISFRSKNSATVVMYECINFFTKQGGSMFKKFIVLTILAVSSVAFLPAQGKAAVTANETTYSENITTPATVVSFQRRNRRSRRWESRRWRNNRSRSNYRRDDRRDNRRDDRRNNRRRGRGRN